MLARRLSPAHQSEPACHFGRAGGGYPGLLLHDRGLRAHSQLRTFLLHRKLDHGRHPCSRRRPAPGNRGRIIHLCGHRKSHAARFLPNPSHRLMNEQPLWHFDHRGRTARTTRRDHVRDMIHQFLFTQQGQRVNRPSFGAGLDGQIFKPNSLVLADTLEFNIQAGLQEIFGSIIELTERPRVVPDAATLTVRISYRVRGTGEKIVQEFSQPPRISPSL